ncbi:hypothetical protein SEA_BLACKBRAIN_11 [Mycobacterium phage Blackbrain]|nr:hypothetical protein SEA_BLACKBRAIN_11 [Mycobacterium phage Blackbrain]
MLKFTLYHSDGVVYVSPVQVTGVRAPMTKALENVDEDNPPPSNLHELVESTRHCYLHTVSGETWHVLGSAAEAALRIDKALGQV